MSDAAGGWRRELVRPFNLMLLAVPAAAALRYGGAADVWVFAGCGVALVPLAGLMGRATEGLAARFGPTIAGLLNATFGNAAELIIALIALSHGQFDMVKATITGSIIGNVLLVFGLALLCGGLRYRQQTFNRTNASVGATLLALAAAGLLIPTLYYYLYPAGPGQAGASNLVNLSEEIAGVLIVVYGLSLLFTLHTHRHLTTGGGEEAGAAGHGDTHWGPKTSVGVLLAAVLGVVVVSEWFVGVIEPAAHRLGMNNVFIGVIVVALVGNAAEHFTAVLMAWRNQMEIAVQIAVGSSTQIALFVAPVLVFASLLMGHAHPLDLHFTPLEVAAVAVSVGVIALVCHDGESNWLEGAMLLALYLMFALAFFNLPTVGH
jgi:Ca2+:H+ antiporter